MLTLKVGKMSDTVVRAQRATPLKSLSLKKLRKIVREDSFYKEELALMPSGEAVLLKAELGFFEMTYHVAVYEPRKHLLRGSRMVCVKLDSFENHKSAVEYFEQVVKGF